jgi:hypothetical protein
MRSFRLVFEFQDAPDEMTMEVAKALVSNAIELIPNSEMLENDAEYVTVLKDINREEQLLQ